MDQVANAMKRAQVFAGTDPTRENLTSVYVDTDRVWSTDGHRAYVEIVRDHKLIPGGYVDDRRTDHKAPPIDYVIPSEETPEAVILDQDHIKDLRALELMIDRRASIVVEYTYECGTRLCLERETGSAKKKVKHKSAITWTKDQPNTRPRKAHDGRNNVVALNLRYLLDAIDVINPRADCVLYQLDNMSPILIKDAHDRKAIIMPVRV